MTAQLKGLDRNMWHRRMKARPTTDSQLALRAIQLGLLVTVAGLVSVWLGQDANWDLQNYHLYNAFAFLNDRYGLDSGSVPQWYLNPLIDIPYYLLVRYVGEYPRLVAFLQGCQAGVVWFILWRLLGKLTNDYDNLIARTVVWVSACTGSMLISEVGTTFDDIAITAIVLWSVLLLVDYIHDRSKVNRLTIAYFLLGIAMGLKLTAAIYLVAALISSIFMTRNIKLLVIICIAGVSGVVLSGGWWFLHLQLHYSSPVFPFYNGFFRSDWWPAITIADHRFLPRSILQWLAYPAFWIKKNQNLVTEVPFADGRMLVGLISALAGFGTYSVQKMQSKLMSRASSTTPVLCGIGNGLRNRWPDLVLICSFFLISYVAWLRMFSIYRYAMPLECLSPVVAFVFAIRLPSSANFRRLGVTILCGVVLVMMAFTQYPDWMRVNYSSRVLSVTAPFDYRGATVLAVAGDPPISFSFTQLPGVKHFITIGPDGFQGTKIFNQQSKLVNHSRKIYIITKNGVTPELADRLYAYWHIVVVAHPCVTMISNIGGSFEVCELRHEADFPEAVRR